MNEPIGKQAVADAVVECRNVRKTYQKEAVPVHALQGVDFVVQRGDFLSLSGPSGSGKSTLLNVIGGLDRPDEGEVLVDGVALSPLSESALAQLRLNKIGFVFQAYNLLPVLTALENAEFTLLLRGMPSEERHRRVHALFEEIGLEGLSDRRNA